MDQIDANAKWSHREFEVESLLAATAPSVGLEDIAAPKVLLAADDCAMAIGRYARFRLHSSLVVMSGYQTGWLPVTS
jgi:hypothetical protein